MIDEKTPDLLPWTTPRLESLGTMEDVQSEAGGDFDMDGFPELPAS
jgi:hypothetical protein